MNIDRIKNIDIDKINREKACNLMQVLLSSEWTSMKIEIPT